MFKRIFVHEVKNMVRDKMYGFLALFAIIMIVIASFLIPYLMDNASKLAADIATLFFILMNSFYFGAVTGFTLLDDQDDNVLLSLKITPISVKKFIGFKLLISYLFSVLATFGILLVTDIGKNSDPLVVIMITLLTAMQSPILALIINMFSHNKVEGFVIMKLSGVILMAPVASFFLTDWKEIFLMILPGFWPARLISMELLSLEFFIQSAWVYFVIGILVNFLLIMIFFRFYRKRIHV